MEKDSITTNDIHKQMNQIEYKKELCRQLEERNKELIQRLKSLAVQQNEINNYRDYIDNCPI